MYKPEEMAAPAASLSAGSGQGRWRGFRCPSHHSSASTLLASVVQTGSAHSSGIRDRCF